MLGTLINDLTERLPGLGLRDPLLLTASQFRHELARERVRATRRSIPFCVITIKLHVRRRSESRLLIRLLHRNLRITDRKAHLAAGKFGVLLVDTPEMGGRSALDRLGQLADQHKLRISVNFQCHDPDGFDPNDDPPEGGQRRRDDEPSAHWLRADVQGQVATEDATVPRPFLRMAAKRAIDIVGSSVGLVMAGPLILGAMIAIRRYDSGPAFFTQTREGYLGRPFTIYKLRTMDVDAETLQAELRSQSHRDGPAFKIARDPRVTPIGSFLRKTCIDELPQLWNVFKGDMSLVGPRPLPWHESRACQIWHRRRLEVRPGLTCDWQIRKSEIESFDDWMRLDLRYIDEIGLFRDLKLIAQTVTVPLGRRGNE